MLIIPPTKYRKKRRLQQQAARPAGLALVLQAATYDGNALEVTLQFDRAIDIAGFDPSAIVVRDGAINGTVYTGTSGSLAAADTVVVLLLNGVEWDVNETVLYATAGSGITAVNDGGTWDGVSDVGLPYPWG